MHIKELLILSILLCQAAFAVDHTITVNVDKVTATLAPNYHGVNYCAFWDNQQGSVGSREALRRAGVQILRYPGGVPGNYTDWAKIAGSYAGTNTDSLWSYAKAVGAKLMLQTNPFASKINDAGDLNDPSGVHVAAWVTYCKSKGVDAPYWEIGNEPEGEAPISWNYPAMDSVQIKPYFDRFNEQAVAMKAANPAIKIMGPSAANTWYWWAQGLLEVFLRYCDKNTDAISLHWYGDGSTYDAIAGFAQSWYPAMNFIRTKTQKPLYITEWNNHGSSGNINTTVGNAIVNADVIGVFTRTGVAGHTFFGPIHGASNGGYGAWGILYGPGDAKPLDTPAPSYFILPLWTHMGNSVLQVVSTADTVKTLTVYANKKADGSVQVMLVNKSTQRTVEIKFTGLDPAGKKVLVYELKPQNGQPSDEHVVYNSKVDPKPATEDLPLPADQSCPGQSMTVTLAPYSITELDFLPVTDPTGLSIVNFGVTPSEVWNTAETKVSFFAEVKKTGGTIASATLDLTSLGGSASTAMIPLQVAGTYSCTQTIAQGMTEGSKSVTLTVTDNLGNKKTSIVSVNVKQPKKEFIIYTDASSISNWGWHGNGTLTEISTGAYEGTKCWDYNFTVTGGWAGCGILLYTWGVALDPAGYKSIRFAYKGPASTLVFQYVGGSKSQSVDIKASATWTKVELPIASFGSAAPIDCINIAAAGANGTTGHIYLDDIRLVPESASITRGIGFSNAKFHAGLFDVSLLSHGRLVVSTGGSGRIMICNTQGRIVARRELQGETEMRLSLPPAAYLVSYSKREQTVSKLVIVR